MPQSTRLSPVSCFNEMYSSQGISRIVNIKLIPKCVTKEYKRTEHNLGFPSCMKKIHWNDCCLLFLYCQHYPLNGILEITLHLYLSSPAYLTTLSKGSLLWNLFLCLSPTHKLRLPGPIRQTNTSLRINWFSWLQLFLHASLANNLTARSTIGYRHPQQIVATFIIPINVDPDLATDHPIRGYQYPSDNF